MKPACKEAAQWLFDYAAHTGSLDNARHELVKLHLESCPACRQTAEDMAATAAALLRIVPPAIPARLSEERRSRILATAARPPENLT